MISPEKTLRDTLIAFIRNDPHTDLARFKANLSAWGSREQVREPQSLPASQYLSSEELNPTEQTKPILRVFEKYRDQLFWEQTYTRADKEVSDDLLQNYGFAEIIGCNGPFVSSRIRAGIGVWGPNIVYPKHHHQAEETYYLLGGSAEFQLGIQRHQKKRSGDVVFVSSRLDHGFRTINSPLVLLYLWQNGDLREKSTFV